MNGVGNGGMMQGSGTGFMGFGPTGFTTPIDTVLDRFGRTGTIFPSVNNHHVGMNGSVLGVPPNYGPGKNIFKLYLIDRPSGGSNFCKKTDRFFNQFTKPFHEFELVPHKAQGTFFQNK